VWPWYQVVQIRLRMPQTFVETMGPPRRRSRSALNLCSSWIWPGVWEQTLQVFQYQTTRRAANVEVASDPPRFRGRVPRRRAKRKPSNTPFRYCRCIWTLRPPSTRSQ